MNGVSRIVRTEYILVKLVWTIMILISLAFGVYYIFDLLNDYNKFDVITNVNRVTSDQMAFPAITICTSFFDKFHFINNSLFKYETTTGWILREMISSFYFKRTPFNTSKVEFFETASTLGNCLRFNGLANIKDLETISSSAQTLDISLFNQYRMNISRNEYIVYRIGSPYFNVYIEDNYINAYSNALPISLEYNKSHTIPIVKAEKERKLGEPYNQCNEDKTYRQKNCIEICVNTQIKNKYNCSIPSTYKVSDTSLCSDRLRLISNFLDYYNSIYSLRAEFFKVCKYMNVRQIDLLLINQLLISGIRT